jgi:hypothetical protein
LVIADLYHFRYWEIIERAYIEPREDLRSEELAIYVRALQGDVEAPTYNSADDTVRTTEDSEQTESEMNDQTNGAEVPESNATYRLEDFGQIIVSERVRVEDLRFSASRQAA